MTAWNNVPAVTGTDIQGYAYLAQFWRAALERARAAGVQFWPTPNHIWDSGPVDNLSDNGDGTYTLTDDHPTLILDNSTPDLTSSNRWFGFSNPSDPTVPANYVLVIDDPDESKVVQADILGSNFAAGVATYLLGTPQLTNYVTSAQIPSIASLIGKTYYIIRSGGLWSSDRLPEWANDFEYWIGSATASTTTSITDSAATWAAHQWQPGSISYELMMFNGSILQRIPILDNTSTMITFAALAGAPTGAYVIVKAGARWRGGVKWPYKAWYRGAVIEYYSHYPDDSLTGTKQPLAGVTLASGPPGCTGSFFQPLYDVDFISDFQDTCNQADLTWGPDLFKTFRGLQLFIESICQWFVDKNLTYDNNTAIAPFVPATFFKTCGINAYTTTVSALSGGGIDIPAQLFPYTPIPVHFAVLDAAGNVQNSSAVGAPASATSTTHLDGSFTGADVGCTLVLSLGWTRYYPREVLSMFYDAWCFIPDISTGAMGDPPAGTPVDPPTSASPGRWKKRPISTTYKNHSTTGVVQEGTFTFNDQDAARFGGDNWNDPTIQDPLIAVSGGDTTLMGYQDNFFLGWHDPSHSALDAMPSGKSTGGSTTQLQDTTAHLWGSVMGTISGTADSGSPTSLGDSTKGSDGRWNAATGRWIGAIAKITVGGTVYRRPITTFSGTTIGWTEALPGGASGNGKTYAIDEPGAGSASVVGYTRNRYAGRILTVTDPAPGGLTYSIPILNNDDNTFYFAAQAFTIGADWAWSVAENKPGGVWLWDAAHSQWIVPTGMDPRGALWHANQAENLPTKFQDFGRVMKGDYVGQATIQEIYNALQQLKWTWGDITWDSELVDGTPENNYINGFDLSYTDYAHAQSGFATEWAGAPDLGAGPPAESWQFNVGAASGPPFAVASAYRETNPPSSANFWRIDGGRVYCYGVVTCPTFMQSSIEMYVYGSIDAVDDAASSPAFVFDANGDTIAYHVWKKFYSAGASNAASRKSTAFGSSALPAPDAPAQPASNALTNVRGYYALNARVIHKWDVAGGMTYV